jgi:preprotein translocase subunit SecD
MTGHRIAFALAEGTFVVLAVAACGGGDATSSGSPTPLVANASGTTTATPASAGSGRAVVLADLSSVASPQDTIEKLEQVVQDRLGDAGVRSNISQTSDAELTIDFTGARSTDFVKQVIEAQNLNFRQPRITASGEIRCQTSGGGEFSVPTSNVHQSTDNPGLRAVLCTVTKGQNGTVEWEPAQADVNGETKTLTQAMIDAGTVDIHSNQRQEKLLLLPFTPEGTNLFAALTRHLVNYPLGFFLGDTLLIAPTVQAEIASGETEITGASDDVLAAARAVLKGGELPVPVRVTSIAPGSPAL